MRAFLDKWALWIALAVLVIGVCAYTATRLVGSGGSSGTGTVTQTAQTVPLDPQARAVAEKFVATAVARKNLVEAWNLASPELKHDLTLAQWKTGTIPVTPYPVGKAAEAVTVQTSYPDVAVLRVTFTPPAGVVDAGRRLPDHAGPQLGEVARLELGSAAGRRCAVGRRLTQ